MTDRTIQQHIDDDKSELENPNLSGQRRRHIQDELNALEHYQKNHPEEQKDPTSLELFCDLNPDAPECKIYED